MVEKSKTLSVGASSLLRIRPAEPGRTLVAGRVKRLSWSGDTFIPAAVDSITLGTIEILRDSNIRITPWIWPILDANGVFVFAGAGIPNRSRIFFNGWQARDTAGSLPRVSWFSGSTFADFPDTVAGILWLGTLEIRDTPGGFDYSLHESKGDMSITSRLSLATETAMPMVYAYPAPDPQMRRQARASRDEIPYDAIAANSEPEWIDVLRLASGEDLCGWPTAAVRSEDEIKYYSALRRQGEITNANIASVADGLRLIFAFMEVAAKIGQALGSVK